MLGWENWSQAAQDAVGDAVPLALGIHGRAVPCSTEIQGAHLCFVVVVVVVVVVGMEDLHETKIR